ncbi:MAG: hypothetical protein J0H94_11900 [Rhizobiales bacterium]|nr:hypothetical protein [Hyphomicrobiales bacterium]
MSFQGKKNIYVCERCKGHIVTVDRDEGITPFVLACRATEGCLGPMRSSMYRVFDQDIGAGFEWYKPEAAEAAGLPPAYAEHVRSGGLLIRKIEPATA